MWQIMWMFSLLPDWVFHLITGLGIVAIIASFLLKFIPFVSTYQTLLKIVGTILLLLGIFFEGSIVTEKKWQARVQEMEEQVRISEDKSKQVNVKIKTVVKEKIKVVKDTQIVIQQQIVEKEKIIDAECKIAPEAINILNDAARLRKGTVTIGPVEPVEDKK